MDLTPPELIIDNVRDHVDQILISEVMDKILGTLTERERDVLRSRFWDVNTLKEASIELKVTRQCIQQTEANSIRKLRSPSCLSDLKKCYPCETKGLEESEKRTRKEYREKKRVAYDKFRKKLPHDFLCPANIILKFTVKGKPYLDTHCEGGYFNADVDPKTCKRWLNQRLKEWLEQRTKAYEESKAALQHKN